MERLGVFGLLALAAIGLGSCGGGGGGGGDGGDGGSSAARTTFTGNFSSAEALATPRAQGEEVQVCVEGTGFCTFVDENGFFTLDTDVGGDVTLVFTGTGFLARVILTDIPFGATVRLSNIHCSTVTGLCEPEDFEIAGGDEVRGPIRCEHGPLRVSHAGTLVIDGNGEDCVRTEGQCELTIEADRVVLQDCETCVRTAGGSDVTIAAGQGGFECHAGEDGIRAAGNSAVHVDMATTGDVDIEAGETAILSEGTASVVIDGDQCTIEGGENALRTNGNATIVTEGCATVDLIGGIDDHGGDDEDDDHDDDDDD